MVSANLLRIARGRTMVIVSHRLSSLIDCDQILVMEQGKVVDIAPHEELVERCLDLPAALGRSRTAIPNARRRVPVMRRRNHSDGAGRETSL